MNNAGPDQSSDDKAKQKPLAWWIGRIVAFVFRTDLPYGKDSKSGFQEALWVLAFVITQGIALHAALKGTEKYVTIKVPEGDAFRNKIVPVMDPDDKRHWAFKPQFAYFLVSLATWGCALGIMRARTNDNEGTEVHLFNKSTVRFSGLVLLWSVLLFAYFECGASKGQLAHQQQPVKPLELLDRRVETHDFTKGKAKGLKGLKFLQTFKLNARLRGMDVATFLCSLDAELHDGWYVTNARGYVGKSERGPQASLTLLAENKATRRTAEFTILKVERGTTYTVALYLRPRVQKQPAEAATKFRDEARARLNKDGDALSFDLTEPKPSK